MDKKDFFEKAKDEAGNILSNVAQKTEEIAKKSKLKLKISTHKVSIKGHFKKIGKYIYDHKNDFKDNDYISEQLEYIKKLEEKIEETQEELKHYFEEKTGKKESKQ